MDGSFRSTALKLNPTFEMRRRVSDRDKRSLSLILTLGWLVLTLTVISNILLIDYGRFEVMFQEHARSLKTQLLSRKKENEAVMEGFSAYISGMGRFDEKRANAFALQIMQRFPHISMLEVSEEVDQDGLDRLVQRQRRLGYKEFEVKAHDDTGVRPWRNPPEADHYYPIIYTFPLTDESSQVLGQDIASHPHLERPLKQAIATGKYQTSIPFKLVEGDKAYVMFLPVSESTQSNLHITNPKYVVLIVLKTEHLFSGLDELLTDNTDILIYHNQRQPKDPSGHLYKRVSNATSLLPKVLFECSLEQNREGFTLRMERSFGIGELSKGPILAVIAASIFVFIFIRLFTLKRYVMDIDRAREEVRLEILASHDALTNLPNRYQLMSWLGDKIQQQKKPTRLAALFLDLDDFKEINDLYGHRTGDTVLQVVAERIRQELRREDLAVRLGGDEFLVIFSGFTDTEGVDLVAEKLRRKIEAPIRIDKLTLFVGVSIGTALYPEQVVNPTELIELADQSMYKDKKARSQNKVQSINSRL